MDGTFLPSEIGFPGARAPGLPSMNSTKLRTLYVALLLCAFGLSGQEPPLSPRRGQSQEEKDLQNKQRNALIKEDYQKNLDDSRAMVRLSESLRDEIEKNEQYIVSMSAVKKAEEIEKLSKRIRSRMKRY